MDAVARGMCLEVPVVMRIACLTVSVALVAGLGACTPPGYGKGDDTSGVDAAPTGDGTPGDAALDTPTAATCTKSFRLDGHAVATSVWLTGTFSTWAPMPPGAIAMAQGVDGAWTVDHTFDAGSYQYKFIIDGSTWILDPTNTDTVDDGMGNQNSRYICTP